MKQILIVVEKMDDDDPFKQALQAGDLDKFPVPKAHKCEVKVYDLFHENPPAGLKIPKYYFGRFMEKDHQGVLVFEDLSDCIGTTLADGLSRGQMIEIAEAVASLHAYSMINKEWQSAGIDVTMKSMQSDIMDFDKVTADSIRKLKEWNADFFDPLADKLRDLVKSIDDLHYVFDLSEYDLPTVFCNGDLHGQNMMWVKDKDGKASDELKALIDWQICHPGSIGEDFARVFTSSVTADVRRYHYIEILLHYYKCLTKYLGSTPPYTFDQVVQEYKRCFKYGALVVVPGFPMFSKIPAMLGDNPDEKIKELMKRCKALIEDTVSYEEELATK